MSEGQLLRWSFCPRYGQAMIRLRGRMYKIKAPWCRPIFSERNGVGVRVIPIALGWRLNICAPSTKGE